MTDNVILQAWRNPFHRGCHRDYSHHGHGVSSVCGDDVDLYIDVANDIVQDAYFEGNGCVICLGMASLLTEHLIGKTVAEIQGITEDEMLRLAGMEIDRRRRGCALVAFKALQMACCSL